MWPNTITSKAYLLFLLSVSIVLTVACATDSSWICPPEEILESACVCTKRSDIRCKDIQDQEVLSRILYESSEYKYRSLNLYRVSILYIPATIFDNRKLKSLKVFDSTMVSLFRRAPSAEFNSIQGIYLYRSKFLQGVDWKQFTSFTNLKQVVLRNVHLRQIDQSFVDYVPKSVEDFSCYSSSMSKIHDQAFSAFKNIEVVSISKGKVSELKRSMFPTPTKLKTFDFRENKLTSLPEDIFSEMPDLEVVELNQNFLTELPENTYRSVFPSLQAFYVQDNPLKCSCSIRWITVTKIRMEGRFLGKCQVPKNLHGKELRYLTTDDFAHC